MTDPQARSLIEKLSRLTEARGATKAEALSARKKIAELAAKLTPRYQDLCVEGWPGQPVCTHKIVYRLGLHLVCGVCRKQILR
jgi:hypothetical protein